MYITIFSIQGLADSEQLKSGVKDAPRLVVFHTDGKIVDVYVVGKGAGIRVHVTDDNAASFSQGLLIMLAVYYVFDIDYPNEYKMTMSLLDVFVMGNKYPCESSRGHKFVSRKLKKIMEAQDCS